MAYIAQYGVSDVTTDSVNVGRRVSSKNYVNVYIHGTLGGGTVTVEIQDGQGTFKSYPETTFTEATAQSVELHDGAIIRVVVAGATSVDVEVV